MPELCTPGDLPRYLLAIGAAREAGPSEPWVEVTWFGGSRVSDTPGLEERHRVLARSESSAAFAYRARVRLNAAGLAEGIWRAENMLRRNGERAAKHARGENQQSAPWQWFVSEAIPRALLHYARTGELG